LDLSEIINKTMKIELVFKIIREMTRSIDSIVHQWLATCSYCLRMLKGP